SFLAEYFLVNEQARVEKMLWHLGNPRIVPVSEPIFLEFNHRIFGSLSVSQQMKALHRFCVQNDITQ
ncbi:MAG TPA: hypothetical protein VN495_02585, partial [Candidatus Paceibacterota bacterium]|nr:hypothetical protein [Candidatus Paceibacterota bacterium]